MWDWLSTFVRRLDRRALIPECLAEPGVVDIAALRECLRVAARYVPAYRDSLRDLDIDSLASIADFATRVPLLDKAVVRANPDAFLSGRASTDLRSVRTGGSTGTPMRFFLDGAAVLRQKSAMCRGRRWWGLSPQADRHVLVWGRGASFAPGWKGRVQRLKLHAKDWLLGRMRWSAYDLDRRSLPTMLERLHDAKPDFIEGYASALDQLATWITDIPHWRPPPSLQLVICTAEPLDDAQRARIAKTFRVPVANEYGCTEIGIIGYSCPDCGRIHVFSDQLHVEFLNRYRDQSVAGNDNERGEVVVTTYRHHSAPLIRYRLGDDAELADDDGDCPRGPTRLLSIRGRTHDRIRTRDGRVVHGEFFTHVMDHTPGVDRFQVEQQSLERMLIRIEASADWSDSSAERIRRQLREQFGATLDVEIVTEPVLRERSGKYRWVISHVSALDTDAASPHE